MAGFTAVFAGVTAHQLRAPRTQTIDRTGPDEADGPRIGNFEQLSYKRFRVVPKLPTQDAEIMPPSGP